MAAASNKRMTKEKIEVNDKNTKENESVFESNASGKSRQKTSRAGASKKAGHQTAAKTTTRKKTPVKIDITHQRKIQDVTEYRDRLAFETGITLIVIGIVAVFLYISFFGLGGVVGRVFGGICFGFFGWAAWFIPLGIFIGYIFTMVNRGDRRVPRKMGGIIGAFVCMLAITDLLTGKEIITEYYTSNHVLHHGYFECMNLTLQDVLESGKSSGGLIGRWISSLLTKVCGSVGACILLFALLLLSFFVFEGIEIMAALRKRNAYREEMERLYGEVKDEIDFSEPSYTVLRGKTAISPFGERSRCKEEKQEETDIRKKYSHASENNIKNKNKFDYVERVRENSDNVMQSVDLKMMGKFLDEQKKKQSIKEKTKKENKINKAADVSEIIKDSNETESISDKISGDTQNQKKDTILKSGSTLNAADLKSYEKKPDEEPIPIFREEMNQKFGRGFGSSLKQQDSPKNETIVNESTAYESSAFSKDYKPEIIKADKEEEERRKAAEEASAASMQDFETQKYDDTQVEKHFKDENDKETVVDIDDTAVEKTEVNMSDAAEKDKMEVGENLYSYDTTQVESYDTQADVEAENVSAEENNDGDDNDNYNDNALFIEPKEAVSYKKPERADKHGKFGGDDYVSASESFNALNKTKVEEPVIERAYAFPPIELLGEPVHNNDSLSDTELRETAQKLQDTLKSFNVDVKMGAVTCGPTVTRYELLPEQGVRVNKITKLTDDIKLSLAAQSIRIEAPIPGKSAVGIEVPNPTPSSVYFRELLEGEAFEKAKSPLTFAVGKDISGKLILTDIGKMPHLLIAGATGSGKSVCINTLIMSILYKSDPNDVKLIMIDPKVVELSVYNGIPHLMCPVVTDAKEAAATLNWAVREMSDRYNKFTELGVRNIAGYNDKIKKVENPEKAGFAKMPYIVVIVDEFADLMMVASKDVEDAVCRLAQLARAAGIHLVLATQRPSVNVITGTIKANIPSRIAFSVSSAIDSRTILDRGGAEKLLGKGDMLFFPSGYSEPIRVQGAFVTDEEVSDVVEFLKNNNEEPQYNDKVTEIVEDETNDSKDSDRDSKSDRDEYFEEAGRFVIESDRAAAGQLQRKFSIGFNRAGRIIDQLHDAGVVGPAEGTKPRKVLMSKNEFEMMLGNAPEPVSDEEIDAISEKFGQDSDGFVQQ